MFNRLFAYLRNFDWILFFAVLLLISFGLAEIYSVALGQGAKDLLNFKKELVFVGLGLILFFSFALLDYNSLRSLTPFLYIFGVLMLVAVLFFGVTIRGTRGWFNFAGLGFQPVEFIKFIVILFLAKYFSESSLKISPLKHLFISGAGVLVFFALILLQPDFGSGMIILAVWMMIILIAGFKKRYFLALLLMMAIIAAGAWGTYLKPYQKERVKTFLNPSFNPLSQGYNVSQAIIAVGAGGMFGRGIGFGSQSQLKFLPESQNDFIFAVISEELGFLGVVLVLVFFSIFFYRCLISLKKTKDDFGVFFILGVVSLIFIEMFVNIGMNIGILPVVGISLPFLSYGGSAMIANLTMLGVVESIIVRSKLR